MLIICSIISFGHLLLELWHKQKHLNSRKSRILGTWLFCSVASDYLSEALVLEALSLLHSPAEEEISTNKAVGKMGWRTRYEFPACSVCWIHDSLSSVRPSWSLFFCYFFPSWSLFLLRLLSYCISDIVIPDHIKHLTQCHDPAPSSHTAKSRFLFDTYHRPVNFLTHPI